ncbi:proton-coupled amino acid transporter 2-like isoform X1 [Argopecten irradians]|uniref:proton-coupled amino acid transporter 2-like isoform X1 n=1 Tax=Argopecten irradians TaxID=31199 RepID=UPI00371791D5
MTAEQNGGRCWIFGIHFDVKFFVIDFQGLMLLLPSYIGIGFLGLPYMVKLLGLWSGFAGLLFYGFLNELGCLILADSTAKLTERTGERFSDIGRVAEMSMKYGPHWVNQYAEKFRHFVDFCIFMSYGLLLPDLISAMNLFVKDFLLQYVIINDVVSIVGISVLLLPVYLTRRIKLLSYLATAGNIVLFGISIIAFQYICRDLPDTRARPAFKPFDYLSVTSFANDAMFTFDGIVLVLPVRDKMRSTQHYDGWDGVLGLAVVLSIIFNVGCGFYGYLKFGELTQVNFILNLPDKHWIYKSLKLLTFTTVYAKIGPTVYVVVGIMWRYVKGRFTTETGQNCGEYGCRLVLLLLSCSFTIVIPEFDLLISLSGCFGAVFVTILIPFTVKLLVLYGEEESTSPSENWKRKLAFLFCVIILIFGIYSTIAGIGVAVYSTLYHIKL